MLMATYHTSHVMRLVMMTKKENSHYVKKSNEAKKMRIGIIILATIIIGLCSIFTGCSDLLSVQSENLEERYPPTSDNLPNVILDIHQAFTPVINGIDNIIYPQSGSEIAYYWPNKDTYKGLGFATANGSSFDLTNGALTPPPDHPWGENVTIWMEIEYNPQKKELIFTFGPSGCQFDPPAEVWFNWAELGDDIPSLYYINYSGAYLKQLPDDIEIYIKKMCLRIHHFSRYALAYSDQVNKLRTVR